MFPKDGGTLVPGTYTIEVTLLDPQFQPKEFLDVVGPNYENLEGDAVIIQDNKKTIRMVDTYEVE